MRATALEYRLRYVLTGILLILGLWPFWEPWLGLTDKSTWLTLSAIFARQGWLSFQGATLALLVVGIVITALAAWFRLWGAAFAGDRHVRLPQGQEPTLLADGPYRRTRNPLDLGLLLHTAGIALLMPPAGAVFAVAGVWILQVRLAFAEESSMEARFGQPYRDYMARTPRFLPAPRPQVPAAGARAHWGQALLSEIYFVGVLVTLLGFGWSFNATPLLQGILISVGIAIVVQALLPRTTQPAPTIEV